MNIDPDLLMLLGHAGVAPALTPAINSPSGARFFRCALQVNPFEYLVRHNVPHNFATEDNYNSALVSGCRKERVEVVAITDHFRVASTRQLANDLRSAGVHVFLGFEASSNEGVHFLCIFPENTTFEVVERYIGALGVQNEQLASPLSSKTCEQLMEAVHSMGGVAIAAHVCSASALTPTEAS